MTEKKPRGPKSDKLWSDAVRQAVLEYGTGDAKSIRKIRLIAQKVVDLAIQGDMQAIKEIGDRLDGRPKQATEVTGADGDAITVRIEHFGGDKTSA